MQQQQQLPVLKEPKQKSKSNNKILAVLVVLFIIIFTILFLNSQLSKISEIQINGIQYLNSSEVSEASGIKVGDSFFFTSTDKIAERISELSAVNKVTVKKDFPGIIKISILEHEVIAFEILEDGTINALMSSGAEIVVNNNKLQIIDKPILTGWTSEHAYKTDLLSQLALIPSAQLTDISEISPIPSTAFPDRILIYTRTKFEVITAISLLKEKITAMNGVIETQEPGKITLLLADTYVPFYDENLENDETK